MRTDFSYSRLLTAGAALMLAAFMPSTASAQSDLDSAEAQAFLGAWTVTVDSDFGQFMMDLEINDVNGKVAARLGMPDLGGPPQDINDIAKTGDGLTLTWELDAQGQLVDATMILSPDGDDLSTLFTAAAGQFMATGTATRAAS